MAAFMATIVTVFGSTIDCDLNWIDDGWQVMFDAVDKSPSIWFNSTIPVI
jgi:hypothetical protein